MSPQPQPTAQRSGRGLLRFSLRLMILFVSACCLAAWWWQRPYEVESPIQVFAGIVDREPVFETGRVVETLRRRGFGDPVKHGPTRKYDGQDNLYFEEHWRDGVRHGLYRRWSSGELITELEFDRGRLLRVGDMAVEDFLSPMTFAGPMGIRMNKVLQMDTEFHYNGQPLRDVVEDIRFRHDIHLLLDQPAFDAAGIATDTPLTSSLRQMPLFAALSAALAPLDLTCAYRYEQLWITTPDHRLLDQQRLSVGTEQSPLAQTLDQEASLVYRDQRLAEVLEDISSRYDIAFVNRAEGLADERVTFGLRGVSLRSALATLFYLYGLSAEAENDAIVVREASGG